MTFLCRVQRTIEVPAATPTVVDVAINGARAWLVVVKNLGDGALNGLTVAASPLGELFEAPIATSDGLPLAPGDSLPGLRGNGEPVTTLRLVVTSTAGTTLQLEAGGW